MKTKLFRIVRLAAMYLALAIGLLWLHDPFKVSMDAAASTVKFVYQQF